MNWGSDELHHRSAELTGWCAELRAADPETVDETVAGAVDYAARTNPLPDDEDGDLEADDLDAESYDADDPPDSADPADGTRDGDADTGDDADEADADSRDSGDDPDSADTDSDDTDDPADEPDGYVCSLCGGDIPDGEALDADGAPVDVGFQWIEDVEAYHPSCIDKGGGRFLPWAANGVLSDETSG